MVKSKLHYELSILGKLNNIIPIHILILITLYLIAIIFIVLTSSGIIMIKYQNIST